MRKLEIIYFPKNKKICFTITPERVTIKPNLENGVDEFWLNIAKFIDNNIPQNFKPSLRGQSYFDRLDKVWLKTKKNDFAAVLNCQNLNFIFGGHGKHYD